jgi:hypothetical protein
MSTAFIIWKLLKRNWARQGWCMQESGMGGGGCSSAMIKMGLLFRCRHAVVIMQILNWTNQCWLFMTVRYIMRSVRMTTHGW